MRGLKGVILGVANNRSIAWGIAKAGARRRRRNRPHLPGRGAGKARAPARRRTRRACARPLRRHRRAPRIDAVFAEVETAVGRHRFRRPLHRLLRQGPADRPLRRHDGRQFHQVAADLLLFVHGDRAARRKADDERRLDADADLLRRREMDAALQRHGRRQGGAGGERALSRRRSRREEHPRQRDLGRPDQDAGGLRHRRFPLHPALERI